MTLASSRPEPIPFYAEMSSVNPIFILPSALCERSEAIAKGLHASVTLGAGQFCTNPGLVFIPQDRSEKLIERLSELMATTAPFTMLTPGICSAYREGAEKLCQNSRVELIAEQKVDETGNCLSGSALFQTDANSFLEDQSLGAEVFGPATLLIKYSSREQLINCARSLEGQLTATIHADEKELKNNDDLIAIVQTKAGRLVFNGFPTGVEVGHAMVHGGPFPATSDGRSTSVGTRAALRFTRLVCYQDWPDEARPVELKKANPLHIWRMVDCQMTNWHRDHVGGVRTLATLIPIKHYYDHGLPQTIAADMQAELIEAYRQTTQDNSVTLKPADEIKLQGSPKYLPPLEVRVLAA